MRNETADERPPAPPGPRGVVGGLLEKKVALVTGASRGIGAATAITFAKAGAKVVLAARDGAALREVEKAIDRDVVGAKVVAVPTDVTNAEAVRAMIEVTLDAFGGLDVAFNNAGGGHRPTPLAELSEEDYDLAMNVNAKGTFLCMKYEIPAMLKGGRGAIVNMSSTAGLQGVNGISAYVASKHAVVGLTRAAAMDYASRNIRVNAVAPGPILTERLAGVVNKQQAAFAVPIGHVGAPEEVAAAVVWLCSDLSTFTTGAVIPVDGGRLSGVSFSRPDATTIPTESPASERPAGRV